MTPRRRTWCVKDGDRHYSSTMCLFFHFEGIGRAAVWKEDDLLTLLRRVRSPLNSYPKMTQKRVVHDRIEEVHYYLTCMLNSVNGLHATDALGSRVGLVFECGVPKMEKNRLLATQGKVQYVVEF